MTTTYVPLKYAKKAMREVREESLREGERRGYARATEFVRMASTLNGSTHAVLKALQDESPHNRLADVVGDDGPDIDAVLMAAIDALAEAKTHHPETDGGPVYAYLAGLLADPEALAEALAEMDGGEVVGKSFDESKHPRGDNGRFIGREQIHAAKSDPKLAEELRAKTTDPEQRKKLDAALEGSVDLGRTKAGEHRERVAKQRQDRAERVKRAQELANEISMWRRGGEAVPSSHFRELAEVLPSMTVAELRSVRGKLAASFGGDRRKAEMAARLLDHAKNKAALLETNEKYDDMDALDFGSLHEYQNEGNAKGNESRNPNPEEQHGGRMEQRHQLMANLPESDKTARGTPDVGSVLKHGIGNQEAEPDTRVTHEAIYAAGRAGELPRQVEKELGRAKLEADQKAHGAKEPTPKSGLQMEKPPPPNAAPSAKPAASKTPSPVASAAASAPTGWVGDDLLLINHAFRHLQATDPAYKGMTLDQFKADLIRENGKGVQLSRADLPQALDPNDVKESEVQHPAMKGRHGGEFHFIKTKRAEQPKTAAPSSIPPDHHAALRDAVKHHKRMQMPGTPVPNHVVYTKPATKDATGKPMDPEQTVASSVDGETGKRLLAGKIPHYTVHGVYEFGADGEPRKVESRGQGSAATPVPSGVATPPAPSATPPASPPPPPAPPVAASPAPEEPEKSQLSHESAFRQAAKNGPAKQYFDKIAAALHLTTPDKIKDGLVYFMDVAEQKMETAAVKEIQDFIRASGAVPPRSNADLRDVAREVNRIAGGKGGTSSIDSSRRSVFFRLSDPKTGNVSSVEITGTTPQEIESQVNQARKNLKTKQKETRRRVDAEREINRE